MGVLVVSAGAVFLGATSTILHHTAATIAFGVGCATLGVAFGAIVLDVRERMRYDRW